MYAYQRQGLNQRLTSLLKATSGMHASVWMFNLELSDQAALFAARLRLGMPPA